MSLLDRSWKYTTADESKKPNYLRKKFERIRRELAEQQKLKPSVTPIKKASAK
jgi:hypothetical protein